MVILSQFSDPSYALALLEQGSDGRAYLLKERVHNRAELMAAIRAVIEGGSMIDPKVVESLVVARSRAKRSPLNELTSRELQVLAEIAQGKSNTAIADSLFLTKRAVEKHINAIFWKLGLADAADVSKRVQGRADVPGRGGREPGQLTPRHVGGVAHDRAREPVLQPAPAVVDEDQQEAGEQRDRGEHHAREPHDGGAQAAPARRCARTPRAPP